MADIDERLCWICYGTDADFPNMKWISPCRCNGTMQYVHEACLLRWIAEKELDRFEPLRCPQCNTRLIVSEQNRPWLVSIGDIYLETVSELAPFAIVVGLGAVCWSGLACYGALVYSTTTGISIRQLVQRHNPLVLIAVLPILPCVLVVTQVFSRVKLEITVDTHGVWRLNFRNTENLPALGNDDLDDDEGRLDEAHEEERHDEDGNGGDWDGDWEEDWEDMADPAEQQAMQGHVANTQVQAPVPYARLVMGSLLFPFVASSIGNALFGSISRKAFDRTMMGGIVFQGCQYLLGMLYRHQKATAKITRRVLEYSPTNAAGSNA
eukprot:TRINITY_DN4291_c0_g1_i1.p1 TRINITY_DN4291_c0_g1~~TRINITY_DN4291_c0_g1_i1.p1  ORF type:complete len:323 (+),score=42.71 TRINITY_DN4291_c0_g1_i1:167-1135(+)